MAHLLYAYTEEGQDGGTWYCLTYPPMHGGESGYGKTRYFADRETRDAAVDLFKVACQEVGLFPLVVTDTEVRS